MSAINEVLSIAVEHHRSGRLDAAVDIYRQIIAADPSQPDPYHLLGVIARQNGKHELAIDFFRHAISLKNDSEIFFNNLGGTYMELRRSSEAIACFRRSIEIAPTYAIAHNNLGGALIETGQVEEVANCFRSAVRLNPNYAEAHSNLLMTLQYEDGVTSSDLRSAHSEFQRRHAQQFMSPAPRACQPRDRPRWGFVSADLGRHPVGYFLVAVLERLQQHGIDTYCYSDREHSDDLTQRIKSTVTVWKETRIVTNADLDKQIQADEIDVLFDLGGHTARNRLLVFARKPAPIQVTWAGYVGTTGLKAMDYILADHHEIPIGRESDYCEQVLRMPDGYVCYEPPSYSPMVSVLPALKLGRMTFGCFNYPVKITTRMIAIWAIILHRVPDSRLVLKHKLWNDNDVIKRFSNRFAKVIDPARIEFLPYSPHAELLEHYHQIDIALDTFPYNGGLTTCEALWMGVPVITWPGETFASRHSLSHLSNIGMTDSIAYNEDEYADLAVNWASNLSRLSELRASLRQRMAASALCDADRFTANLVTLIKDVQSRSDNV